MTLPDRGPFRFPAPYGTTGIRITNGSDMGGADALWYCGYSYWQNINAHVGQAELLVFLSIDRQRGGVGPSLWSVDKRTDIVTPMGPIFAPSHPLSWSTGEGWYWSAISPHILYASDLSKLYRVDVAPVLQGLAATVSVVADVANFKPGKVLWQWHSAHDETRHSATVKDGSTYAAEGTVVFTENAAAVPWRYFPARGSYDEAQIDKSGSWLLTKDNIDSQAGEDNLIYDLATSDEPRIIYDQQGAAGHSDNGFGYMVAADNYYELPGAIRLWKFDGNSQPQGQLCYHTPNWDAEMNHLSHCNARLDDAAKQYVIGSSANRKLQPRNNEVCGFRLDGSLDVLVVAPVLTDLNAPGGGSSDYNKLPKGNLDVTGTYFLWTSNLGGPRLDALIVKVPAHLLVTTPVPPPTPTYTVTAPDGTVRHFVEVLR